MIEVVTIGGGTGQFHVLKALQYLYEEHRLSITSIPTTLDSGGSSGLLRTAHGVISPGDIGQCVYGLHPAEPEVIAWVLNHRFNGTGGLRGHTLRNAIVVAAFEKFGQRQEAMDSIRTAFGLIGSIAPVTWDQAHLCARLHDGTILKTEDAVYRHDLVASGGIEKLWLEPEAAANPAALRAIRRADVVIVCPGTLACSLLPNFLVRGIREALQESDAWKICVSNLMNRHGHVPPQWTVRDHVEHLEEYLGKRFFDIVIQNTQSVRETQQKYYAGEKMAQNPFDEQMDERMVIAQPLLLDVDDAPQKDNAADALQHLRASVRHDPRKLAQALGLAFSEYVLRADSVNLHRVNGFKLLKEKRIREEARQFDGKPS